MHTTISTLLPKPYCPSDTILPVRQGASQTGPCVENTRKPFVSHGYGFLLPLSSYCAYIQLPVHRARGDARDKFPNKQVDILRTTGEYFSFCMLESARTSTNPGHRILGKPPSCERSRIYVRSFSLHV